MNDLFTPGWTTSKPGDMKNSGGLTTRFAKPAKRPEITPEPRTEFDLDLGKRSMSPEEYNREYVASFAPSDSYAFIKPTDIRPPPPKINRDAPESAVEDAW